MWRLKTILSFLTKSGETIDGKVKNPWCLVKFLSEKTKIQSVFDREKKNNADNWIK